VACRPAGQFVSTMRPTLGVGREFLRKKR
jgi:hypothetical protein